MFSAINWKGKKKEDLLALLENKWEGEQPSPSICRALNQSLS
jgi:hypothetical protein